MAALSLRLTGFVLMSPPPCSKRSIQSATPKLGDHSMVYSTSGAQDRQKHERHLQCCAGQGG